MAQIGGGVFVADQALGFPVGAAEGPADSLSWHAILHGLSFALGMLSLIAALFVLARHFRAVREHGWARYCVATGVAFITLGALGAVAGDWRLVALAIVLGWGGVSILAAHLRSGRSPGSVDSAVRVVDAT